VGRWAGGGPQGGVSLFFVTQSQSSSISSFQKSDRIPFFSSSFRVHPKATRLGRQEQEQQEQEQQEDGEEENEERTSSAE